MSKKTENGTNGSDGFRIAREEFTLLRQAVEEDRRRVTSIETWFCTPENGKSSGETKHDSKEEAG